MTSKTYEEKISKYDWSKLLKLWSLIQEGTTNTEGWDAGKALEYLIVRAFELELGKENVTYPFDVDLSSIVDNRKSIEQIDGVVYVNGISFILECKDYNDSLDVESIAKIRNQLLRRPSGTIGCVFSTSGFTAPAIILAHFTAPQTILLWEKEDIDFAFKKRSFAHVLQRKYRYFVEKGIPNFKIS